MVHSDRPKHAYLNPIPDPRIRPRRGFASGGRWRDHAPGPSVLGVPDTRRTEPFARQASTSRLPEPTPLTVYRVVPQVPPPLCSNMWSHKCELDNIPYYPPSSKTLLSSRGKQRSVSHTKHNPTCTRAMGQDYPLTRPSPGTNFPIHPPFSVLVWRGLPEGRIPWGHLVFFLFCPVV